MLAKTLDEILKNIFKEIEKGITIKRHPYKYGCLSSIKNESPQQRMVVMRKLEKNLLTIYTDERSPKVAQFTDNPEASILFYNPVKMTQIILKGHIKINHDTDNEIWKSLPEVAHKDYTTLLAPGTTVENPEPEYDSNSAHFCYLEFVFDSIDYLNIDRPYHTRTSFKLSTSNTWEGSYVTP